jgi:hypothetical protein
MTICLDGLPQIASARSAPLFAGCVFSAHRVASRLLLDTALVA